MEYRSCCFSFSSYSSHSSSLVLPASSPPIDQLVIVYIWYTAKSAVHPSGSQSVLQCVLHRTALRDAIYTALGKDLYCTFTFTLQAP